MSAITVGALKRQLAELEAEGKITSDTLVMVDAAHWATAVKTGDHRNGTWSWPTEVAS